MGLRTWAAAMLAALMAVGAAHAADTAKTAHVALRLAPQTVAAAPGSTLYVGLEETIAPDWHTYWRNPGDSGEPTAIAWTLPAGWSAGPIVWPAPHRAATGPLVNYVFSDRVVLPTPIQVPASAAPGSRVTLKAAVTYLVCKDVCIPEQAALDVVVPVAAGAPKLDPALGQAITDTLAAAPKAAGLQARFARSGDAVSLSVTGAQLKGADVSHAWFYPYDGQLLDHAKPQQVAGGPDGLTLMLPAGYGFTHGDPPKALDGVLALGGGKAWEVSATPGAALPGAAGASPSRPSASTGDPGETAAAASAPGGASPAKHGAGALLLQIGAAFLGGLILNLMPCVFPVLSIKAAALARHVEAPERARAEGLGYLAGVVATFLVLAGVLIAVRAAGQEVGWGFQLQSAGVTATLTLLMLLVALNLSGVFEVGTSVQGAGNGLASRGGVAGSVFTGVLAVLVAAPCTAPFMAPAIGWALVQPPLAALTVFLGLALGLAAPLALVSFMPAAFRLLPKPGPWMEGLRHVLAFPMYATAAWLAWVFASQAGVPGLPFLFGAGVALAFAAWAWGVGQRQEKPLVPRIAAVAGLIAAVPLAAQGASFDVAPSSASSGGAVAAAGGLDAQPWSPERVAELTAQGKPVFVDFTAAWCITCQVNERGALAGARVADAFRKTGAVYLKADWTRRDATIARVLSANGREGVPLYLVYGPGRDKPQVLPQLLTEGAVAAAIQAAAKPA